MKLPSPQKNYRLPLHCCRPDQHLRWRDRHSWATPENGGTNPVYAWYVNTVEVPGETSDTYAYQPADDDVVYAMLTSDLAVQPTTRQPQMKLPSPQKNYGCRYHAADRQHLRWRDRHVRATPENGGTNRFMRGM